VSSTARIDRVPVTVHRSGAGANGGHPTTERVRFEDRVGIDHRDELSTALPQSGFEAPPEALAADDLNVVFHPAPGDTGFEPFRRFGIGANQKLPVGVLLRIERRERARKALMIRLMAFQQNTDARRIAHRRAN
jgi:hypothetical protein